MKIYRGIVILTEYPYEYFHYDPSCTRHHCCVSAPVLRSRSRKELHHLSGSGA
jgi:hypothetical protein